MGRPCTEGKGQSEKDWDWDEERGEQATQAECCKVTALTLTWTSPGQKRTRPVGE